MFEKHAYCLKNRYKPCPPQRKHARSCKMFCITWSREQIFLNKTLNYNSRGEPTVITEQDAVKNAVKTAAELMVASAKTAPKARGVDNIVTLVLDSKEELEKLASKMEELAPEYGDFFRRDAQNVRNSLAVILIGCSISSLQLNKPSKWILDPDTVNSLVNLGIAIGSAVKTASLLNIDNRVMFTIGVAAQELGLLKADIVYGIPLSVTGKNIYFDRKWPPK